MSTDVVEREVEVVGRLGLHARPAANFAGAAAQFQSHVTIAAGGREVDAASVLSVLTLNVGTGDRVQLRAEGIDAAEAVEALSDLLGTP